jgi:multidrug efflux pump subunit AcrB
VQIPYPYGGKQRQVMVDLDPERLFAWNISPSDVSAVIGAQNLILPAGTTKIGTQEYPVALNSSPLKAFDLNDLPIKTVNGTRSTSRTWPTCATASRCRRAWSTCPASAASSSPS